MHTQQDTEAAVASLVEEMVEAAAGEMAAVVEVVVEEVMEAEVVVVEVARGLKGMGMGIRDWRFGYTI